MHRVEAFSSLAAQVKHPRGHYPQAGALEARDDSADGILAYGVGFDDGKGAFGRHPDLQNHRIYCQ